MMLEEEEIMSRMMLLVVVGMLIFGMLGCGSSTNTNSTVTVQDTATRFVAKNTTIAAGNKVQFMNVDSEPHQIVSGRLLPQGSQSTIVTIVIGNTGFSPSEVQAELGNTIRFSNVRLTPFTMDIVDDNGTVISTVTFAIGEQQVFTFPGAGLFVFTDHNLSTFRGTIVLFGSPNPDGVFQSPVLQNGGTFLTQFSSPGSIAFYDLNLNNPNQSFKTGTIIVQ